MTIFTTNKRKVLQYATVSDVTFRIPFSLHLNTALVVSSTLSATRVYFYSVCLSTGYCANSAESKNGWRLIFYFFIFLPPPPLFLEFPFFFLVPSFLNFTFKNRGRLTQIERLKGDSIVCGDLGDHDLLDPSLDPPQYASLGEKNIYYSFHFEMQIVLKNLDI